MDKTILTPEESLLLITKTIDETKQRFKENGHLMIFWGLLMFIVPLSQYILYEFDLNKLGDYTIHNWPVFLYPIGGIYTFVFAWKEHQKNNIPKTIIGNILGAFGWIVGMNLMILGFLFHDILGDARIPIFIVITSLFVFTCGISIKFKPLLIGGIVLNLIGLATFYFDGQYHTLIMSIASWTLIISGILLNKDKRRKHV